LGRVTFFLEGLEEVFVQDLQRDDRDG
jgi:hypothetical protein